MAEPVLPVPPFVELPLPVVLTLLPKVMAVTLTLTAHELPAATVPPLRVTLPPPAVAVAGPSQVLLRPEGFATTSPDGKLSVSATPVNAVELLGLLMVKVRLVVPLTGTFVASNALVMLGGATTVRLAVVKTRSTNAWRLQMTRATILAEPKTSTNEQLTLEASRTTLGPSFVSCIRKQSW